MEKETFYFEIKDLIIQFLAAFDDCIIRRYDDDRVIKEKLEVRYVLAPKERVIYDIVNETHNITLPVVAVNITSISRDDTRMFNKTDGFYLPKSQTTPGAPYVTKIPTPLPVNISVSMSIIAKYQIDMDQIISNFAPYNNPYIILTWKVPSAAGLAYDVEIRSEVLWDGTISFEPPTQLASTDKYRITAETTFTIKGWLFKKLGENVGNIFVVNDNFYNLRKGDPLRYDTLSGFTFSNQSSAFPPTVEQVSISAVPTITNVFFSNSGIKAEIYDDLTLNKSTSSNSIMLYGTGFDYINNVFLSSGDVNLLPSLTSVSFYKMPSISGFALSASQFDILTTNIILIDIPNNINVGTFDIIVGGTVGYASTLNSKNIVFTLT